MSDCACPGECCGEKTNSFGYVPLGASKNALDMSDKCAGAAKSESKTWCFEASNLVSWGVGLGFRLGEMGMGWLGQHGQVQAGL